MRESRSVVSSIRRAIRISSRNRSALRPIRFKADGLTLFCDQHLRSRQAHLFDLSSRPGSVRPFFGTVTLHNFASGLTTTFDLASILDLHDMIRAEEGKSRSKVRLNFHPEARLYRTKS